MGKMKIKKLVAIFLTILIGTVFVFWLLNSNQIEIDKEKSYISFKGSALSGARSQSGKFDKWDIEIVSNKENIQSIFLEIHTASLDTGLSELNKNLRSQNFLEVKKYPLITFYSESISNEQIIGNLTFKGKTKEIEIPIQITKDQIYSTTKVDVSKFGEDYGVIDENIEINFKLFMEIF
tara:strand:- start:81 stop:617 length:537 start_codon:yes stop_codon:yes gene_type:complete